MDKQHHKPRRNVLDEWSRMKEQLRIQENEADHEEDAKRQGPSIRLRRDSGGGLVAELRTKGTTKTARIEFHVIREDAKT